MKNVFVSSVSQGMEGYSCIKMEIFGARNSTSDAFCRQKVAEADLFIGILGHQYGSIHESSGKSYSEREYDAAVAAKVDRLIFLSPDDFPVAAHLVEDDLRRHAQRAFRHKVRNERIVASFGNEDHLATSVAVAIHNVSATISKMEAAKSALDTEGGREPSGKLRPRTRLLFPFVTNQGGFDTAVGISNVSLDPFGTPPHSGAIVFYIYGLSEPVVRTTTNVTSGTAYTTLISSLAPSLQGYIIADCLFKARGFAFVSDIGARNLMSSYLAEILSEES